MCAAQLGAGTIRVLLADNNPVYLAALARLLALDPQVTIVGQTQSGAATLQQAASAHPHLVVLDLALGADKGLDVVRRLKAGPAPPRVVVTALDDAAGYQGAAAAAGADTFLTEGELGTALPALWDADQEDQGSGTRDLLLSP